MTDLDLDLVLLGATGFVGRLTAAHLAQHAPAGVRVGLAARSADRLAAVRDELGVDWPLVTVDTADEAAVADLAARTRVLVTTVGPYLRYGLPVAAACARAGTHYADLTGETEFVRRSVRANHDTAVASGARIVHSCGFDSIPSDLGLGLAHAAVGGGPLVEATYHVRSARGGISGGTIDSLRQQILEAKADPDVRRAVGDPYTLTDRAGARRPGRGGGPLGVRRDPDRGEWQAPFVMGAYNQHIVQRSNFLQGWSYGPEMRYREVVDTGRGRMGPVRAAALALGQTAFGTLMWFDASRSLVDRVLAKPGEGPSEAKLESGRFLIEVDVTAESGRRARTRFGADLDPGYRGTAVMLGESGLSLALDALPERSGVLTPMTAMGTVLADRLTARDFTIETEPLG